MTYLATISDDHAHLFRGGVVWHSLGEGVDGVHHLEAGDHLPKYCVVAVQVVRGPHHDGEVGGIGVWAHVCHGKQALVLVHELETALIITKLTSKYRFHIHTGLINELIDNAVEFSSL